MHGRRRSERGRAGFDVGSSVDSQEAVVVGRERRVRQGIVGREQNDRGLPFAS
jgi:hypothetical protein